MSAARNSRRSTLVRRGLMVVAVIALLLSVLRLVPLLQERARLQHRLAAVIAQRDRQQILYPLFTELMNADQADAFAGLVPPGTCPLRQDEVATVSTLFEQLAVGHGFAIGRVRLRMISDPPRRLLSVALPLDGAYDQLGPLLNDLLLMPSLEALDRVTVQLEDPVDRIQVEMKLALE